MIEALVKRDIALAKRAIVAGNKINALRREIVEKAIATIARRQPIVLDLRESIGALRLSNNLKRIGDLAENVAKPVALLMNEMRTNGVMLQFQRMVQLLLDQFRRARESHARRDLAEALEEWRGDRNVDAFRCLQATGPRSWASAPSGASPAHRQSSR